MGSKSNKTWWGQVLHNRLIALVLAMLVAVPLVATPADTLWHGAAAFTYEGLAVILMGVLLWKARWNLTRQGVQQFFKTGSHLPLILFGLWAALSTLLAGRNAYGGQALLGLGAGIMLYFVIASEFRRSEQLTKLVDTLVFVLIGGSLIGFAQYSIGSKHEAVGLFSDHQLFGSFLMILLPLVGVQAINEKHPGRQLAAQVATVFGVAALLISQARSAWIGAIAGLAVLAVLALIAAQRNRTVAARKHEAVLPIMLLTVAAGFFVLVYPQSAKFMNRASSLDNVSAVQTWNTRRHVWQGVMKMIGDSPLFGHGLGQYPLLQNGYTHVGFAHVAALHGATLSEQAHNFYLQTTAELGLVGMILFASVLVVFWISGLRRVLQMDAGIRRNLLLGSLASTIAFAVDAIASPSWQLSQIVMFLWLSLGIGVCCMQRRTRAEELDELETVAIPARLSRPVSFLGAIGVALLLPTVIVSADPTYGTPISAVLAPKSTQTGVGGSVEYSLFVIFQNGSGQQQLVDVSEYSSGHPVTNEFTNFTYSVGTGTGINHRDYTATNPGNVSVTGTYTDSSGTTLSDTGKLRVK
jgi:O-antigen ligase